MFAGPGGEPQEQNAGQCGREKQPEGPGMMP
jgi:hypothetical protein